MSLAKAGSVQVDTERCTVSVGNRTPKVLTELQVKLLVYLMRRQNQVCTKAKIIRDVWDTPIEDQVLRDQIKAIRKVLEENPSKPVFIETILSEGYQFNAKDNNGNGKNGR